MSRYELARSLALENVALRQQLRLAARLAGVEVRPDGGPPRHRHRVAQVARASIGNSDSSCAGWPTPILCGTPHRSTANS